MSLPSFSYSWRNGETIKPRIYVLEVRNKDRPDDKAMAWLYVEREETYEYDPQDNTVYKASIRLSYERVGSKRSLQKPSAGYFAASYSRISNRVSLTNGAVFLDLHGLYGQRIGTYLMNEIIQWAKQWPTASVKSIELFVGQADEENKERRNWFYEQFGLVFDYTDPEHCAGKSRPILVEALVNVETWKQNITELQMTDYQADVLQAKEKALKDLQDSENHRATLLAERDQAEAHPLRWAFSQLSSRCKHILMSLFS